MGRSVNYLDNAEVIIYFHLENDEGNYDDKQWLWEDLVDNLINEIKRKLPSYEIEKDKWDNRETRILLSNKLCNIGISEYCGLVSLSVAPKIPRYYSDEQYKENFAVHHANQIEKTLQKIVDNCTGNRLNRKGTFSNGMGIFESSNNKESVYENGNRIL
jgi:hypothetical protein